jgi:hypothetical protein
VVAAFEVALFQPVSTAVPPRPAKALPAASAATPVVYEVDATTEEDRAPDPEPLRVTVVEAAALALKYPTPLCKSAAPKVIDVADDGATEVKAFPLLVAFATFPEEAVTVKVSSPPKAAAFPAESLNVTFINDPQLPEGEVEPDPSTAAIVAVVGAPEVVKVNDVDGSPETNE